MSTASETARKEIHTHIFNQLKILRDHLAALDEVIANAQQQRDETLILIGKQQALLDVTNGLMGGPTS